MLCIHTQIATLRAAGHAEHDPNAAEKVLLHEAMHHLHYRQNPAVETDLHFVRPSSWGQAVAAGVSAYAQKSIHEAVAEMRSIAAFEGETIHQKFGLEGERFYRAACGLNLPGLLCSFASGPPRYCRKVRY
ncbi:MAG: hypothetical protein KTR20_15235 [Cellvibrionaceae bacterium]|nr:hypothetical protein [Cellvibrionaceae bacterium]